MNELQRQAYLSAIGIESYMPRWRLLNAPEPITCLLPVVEFDNSATIPASPLITEPITTPLADSSVAIDMLANVDTRQKSVAPINAAAILQQLEEKQAPVLAPFSLSIWRPVPGFLIIDSRNTAMALPTELLLGNVLRVLPGLTKPDLTEEVLRWPMIENRFVSRTEMDARNELQTWLTVENELRPIKRLWLMGNNASQYFVAYDIAVVDNRWKKITINGLAGQGPIEALLLPSLNELLQNPLHKSSLWAALD